MRKRILVLASFLGAVSVLIGAMGSHVFEDYLISVDRLETFEISVKYQFYHIFLLLSIGLCYNQFNTKFIEFAFYFVLLGFFLFCGSLYLLCFTDNSFFGLFTPLGGLSFVCAWLCFLFAIIRREDIN